MTIKQVLTRVYVHSGLEQTIAFYEGLFGCRCGLRVSYEEMHLELAQVRDVLILCGSPDALAPFRETRATFLVDGIDECRAYLLSHGAVVIRDLRRVPTGYNLTVRHADGTVVEYVEHSPAGGSLCTPGATQELPE